MLQIFDFISGAGLRLSVNHCNNHCIGFVIGLTAVTTTKQSQGYNHLFLVFCFCFSSELSAQDRVQRPWPQCGQMPQGWKTYQSALSWVVSTVCDKEVLDIVYCKSEEALSETF